MIINTSHSNIETIGDIKTYQTNIDPKNLDFITTLLSSNLYSQPKDSFIREIVSNAWDSHVEAGNTDTPVIIGINKHSNLLKIYIRDYGVGISPERFEQIYCSIGSSTKRESNDYIGAFGIGRFASLACSNMVNITSYYDGVFYHYVMSKDGNKIVINLLNSGSTTEKNGVKIEICDKSEYSSIRDYQTAIEKCVFFPNLYIDSNLECISRLNECKIQHHKYYSVCSTYLTSKLLLGNVLYPLDTSIVNYNSEEKAFVESIKNLGIFIKFNIGDLPVTPNRENIIYTKECKKIIVDKIAEARKEFYNNFKTALDINFENLKDFFKMYCDGMVKFNYVTNKLSNDYTDSMIISKNLIRQFNNFKYCDKPLSETVINCLEKLNSCLNLYKFQAYVSDYMIYTNINNIPAKYKYNLKFSRGFRIINLNNFVNFKSSLKKYLMTNYSNSLILKDFDISKINIKDLFSYSAYMPQEIEDILKDFLTKNIINIDVNTDKDFLEFCEDLKSKKVVVKDDCKNHILRVKQPKHSGFTMYEYKSFEKVVNYLKSVKNCIYLSTMDSNILLKTKDCVEEINIENLTSSINYTVIKVNKTLYKNILSLKLKNVKPLEEFFDRNVFKEIYTYYKYLHEKLVNNKIAYKFDELLPEKYCKIIKNLQSSFYNNNSSLIHCATLLKKEDESLLEDCKYISEFLDYLNEYSFLQTYEKNVAYLFLTYFIKKDKKYRMDYKVYNRLKSNQLITKLCQTISK